MRVPGGGGTYRCAVLIDSSCDGPIGSKETASGTSVCGGDCAPADPRLVANAEGTCLLLVGRRTDRNAGCLGQRPGFSGLADSGAALRILYLFLSRYSPVALLL